MRYIITALLVLMTAGFVACGFLLWRRRRETGDYSRAIQAVLSWVAAFFEPEHTFIPLLAQMTFYCREEEIDLF